MEYLVAFSFLLSWIFSCDSAYVQKYINPCGTVYTTVPPNANSAKMIFHNLKPHTMELIHLLKSSHHKFMDDYKYKNTWVPDGETLIESRNAINIAKQLPEIYRSLQYFSYALDVVKEDAMNMESSADCFFVVDSLPNIIARHEQLVCAVDVAMGQLQMEVPIIKSVTIPHDWFTPNDKSCVHKFFRFSEIHTKYRRFLHKLFYLSHL